MTDLEVMLGMALALAVITIFALLDFIIRAMTGPEDDE